MSIPKHSVAVGVFSALLTGGMLSMTAVGQSTDDKDASMPKKHAACEHMTGKKQMDCEQRMTEMDKKNQPESSSIPTSADKKTPNTPRN